MVVPRFTILYCIATVHFFYRYFRYACCGGVHTHNMHNIVDGSNTRLDGFH